MKPKESKDLTLPKSDKRAESSLQPGEQPKVEITVEGVEVDPDLERAPSN